MLFSAHSQAAAACGVSSAHTSSVRFRRSVGARCAGCVGGCSAGCSAMLSGCASASTKSYRCTHREGQAFERQRRPLPTSGAAQQGAAACPRIGHTRIACLSHLPSSRGPSGGGAASPLGVLTSRNSQRRFRCRIAVSRLLTCDRECQRSRREKLAAILRHEEP